MAQTSARREPLILLGIDPGLANTGWGVVEKRGHAYHALAYGCVTTPSNMEVTARLKTIFDDISEVIEHYNPTELGIEAVYFGVNTKSAFATGQARGAALIACATGHLVVGEYTPMQIKQAVVGTGTADKDQVAYMVQALLNLDHKPRPDHASDALAAAICQGNMHLYNSLQTASTNGDCAASNKRDESKRAATVTGTHAGQDIPSRQRSMVGKDGR